MSTCKVAQNSPIKQSRTAADLLARFRTEAPSVQSAAPKLNTKAPLAEGDRATVRDYIEQHQPAWLLAFYDLSLETGWRTADVANLRYDSIDFDTGTVTITVAKQTKAAQARALARGLKEIREARKNAALAAGDASAFMLWSAADRDELAAAATPEELARLKGLVANAPRKVDAKRLSAGLLGRLAQMREDSAIWESEHVFSRRLTASNNSRGSDAPITRSTMWSRMKAVFAAVAEQVENAAKLSAYSLRKSFAVALYNAAGRSVAAVMRAMGHSSEAMSLRYMGMDDAADRAQAVMVGAA